MPFGYFFTTLCFTVEKYHLNFAVTTKLSSGLVTLEPTLTALSAAEKQPPWQLNQDSYIKWKLATQVATASLS